MSSGIRRGRAAPEGDAMTMFNLGNVPLPREPRRHPSSFECAYRQQYELDNEFGLHVNIAALRLYGRDGWLGMDDIVARALALVVAEHRDRGRIYRWTMESEHPWLYAGRQVASWVGHGIVVEEPGPDGTRGWRLVSREPIYAEEGRGRDRRVVRIRGLPPEEQAARYALEERRAKIAARCDEKARHNQQLLINSTVAEILSLDPDFLVPSEWVRYGFVDQALVGERLDVAADIIRGAHHLGGLTREQLKTWILVLWKGVSDARDVERPATIDLPDADDAALESLVL